MIGNPPFGSAIRKASKGRRTKMWCLDVPREPREQCGCGGSYIRGGTPQGAASYRAHIQTARCMTYVASRYKRGHGVLFPSSADNEARQGPVGCHCA